MIATQPTLDLETPSDAGGGVAAVTGARPRSMATQTPPDAGSPLTAPPSRSVVEAAGSTVATVPAPRPAVHDTPAILRAVLSDPLPSRQTDREVIEAAIVRCAAEHGGLVTIAWVRPHVTREVFPNMWGAVLRPRKGFLEVTDRHPERNEGGSGNANKWSPVYRLVTHV